MSMMWSGVRSIDWHHHPSLLAKILISSPKRKPIFYQISWLLLLFQTPISCYQIWKSTWCPKNVLGYTKHAKWYLAYLEINQYIPEMKCQIMIIVLVLPNFLSFYGTVTCTLTACFMLWVFSAIRWNIKNKMLILGKFQKFYIYNWTNQLQRKAMSKMNIITK
jgi:hypothetical protein